MQLFHSLTESQIRVRRVQCHTVFKAVVGGGVATGDYKCSSRTPQLSGTGLEKAILKNEKVQEMNI